MSDRISWPEYFLGIAAVVATRATCPRRRVGAVIVQNNRILSCGYNGSAPGEPHCDDVGCDMVDGHCKRTIHAERNALRELGYVDFRLGPVTLYTTLEPCAACRAVATDNCITQFVWDEDYPPR